MKLIFKKEDRIVEWIYRARFTGPFDTHNPWLHFTDHYHTQPSVLSHVASSNGDPTAATSLTAVPRLRPWLEAKVEVTLWLTVSQSACICVGHPFGGPWPEFTFPFFCRKIALLFVLGRPLWREDGSVICSAICRWSQSQRTHNHTLLSHLRLLASLSVASYESQGLWWKYSYPPPHRDPRPWLWEREKKVGGGIERHYRFGGGCNRNIIWQFGRFPGSAR
jgi:hypothetical protein